MVDIWSSIEQTYYFIYFYLFLVDLELGSFWHFIVFKLGLSHGRGCGFELL